MCSRLFTFSFYSAHRYFLTYALFLHQNTENRRPMRYFIFYFFMLCISFQAFADIQSRPTQPYPKINTTPPANYSMCVNSINVCVDNATYNQTSEQIFNDYCSPDDEYFTKVAVSFDCKTPNPKRIQCFRCACPPNQLRDLETHLCIPEQYCMYGIRDHVTGGCWPADCAYGECSQPQTLQDCQLSENAVLRSTADPMQDECVCPVGSNWSQTLSQCITCAENEEFDDFAGVCMPKNCDIKPPPDLPPDYDPWREMAACQARHFRSQDRAWTTPIYYNGYCWSPHELMTTFCNAIYQDCKFYNLFSNPDLSDQKRADVCHDPVKPKSSVPNSSTPSSHANSSQSSSAQNSVASASIASSFSSENASQNSSQNSANTSANSVGSLSSQSQTLNSSQASQGVQTSQVTVTSQPSQNNNQSSAGKGDCDPTSKDYDECMGRNKTPSSAQTQEIINQFKTTTDKHLQDYIDLHTADIEKAGKDGISFRDAPDQIKTSVLSLFPQPSQCQVLTVKIPFVDIVLECTYFDVFKMYFGWFLSALTVIYIFQLALKPVEK